MTAARTGTIGDGKIFVTKIDDAIRIRNDERGDIALKVDAAEVAVVTSIAKSA